LADLDGDFRKSRTAFGPFFGRTECCVGVAWEKSSISAFLDFWASLKINKLRVFNRHVYSESSASNIL
jgi:hypothetical protein